MKIIKKIDDVGRIAIPRDLRRSLRWMGGDEIAIIPREDGTLLLQKNETDVLSTLYELRNAWTDDAEVADAFNNLIVLIDNKK
jgi:AbrB family looped-hinge helix DNA binding protein